MKPLNFEERKKIFMKFLMASITVLGLFGYSIYSYVFVKEDISTTDESNIEEIEELNKFLDKADVFVASFKEADNETDRSNFRLEMNSLIRENQDSYASHGEVFNKISARYRDVMRSNEIKHQENDDLDKICDEKIEEFELQIEELEEQIEDHVEREEEIKKVKSALERVTDETSLIASEISDKDWCKGPGEGRDEIKNELKLRLIGLSKDIMVRIEDL